MQRSHGLFQKQIRPSIFVGLCAVVISGTYFVTAGQRILRCFLEPDPLVILVKFLGCAVARTSLAEPDLNGITDDAGIGNLPQLRREQRQFLLRQCAAPVRQRLLLHSLQGGFVTRGIDFGLKGIEFLLGGQGAVVHVLQLHQAQSPVGRLSFVPRLDDMGYRFPVGRRIAVPVVPLEIPDAVAPGRQTVGVDLFVGLALDAEQIVIAIADTVAGTGSFRSF